MTPTLDEDVTAGPQSLQASVRVDDERWYDVDPVAVADMVLTAISASGSAPAAPASCDIVFTDDSAMRDLNHRFRGKDAPTNVLAFPSGEEGDGFGHHFLGGIALSCDTLMREAGERGISVTDHATHLTLHGMMHLLGYDHEVEDDREEMERVEVNILAGLGVADPYEGS